MTDEKLHQLCDEVAELYLDQAGLSFAFARNANLDLQDAATVWFLSEGLLEMSKPASELDSGGIHQRALIRTLLSEVLGDLLDFLSNRCPDPTPTLDTLRKQADVLLPTLSKKKVSLLSGLSGTFILNAHTLASLSLDLIHQNPSKKQLDQLTKISTGIVEARKDRTSFERRRATRWIASAPWNK